MHTGQRSGEREREREVHKDRKKMEEEVEGGEIKLTILQMCSYGSQPKR
jgi:hypothetical protein